MALCQISEKFGRIKCHNEAWPGDPEGLCILHSLQPSKPKSAFEEAIQQKFDVKDYNFSGIFFPWSFSFRQKLFDKRASFENTIFSEEVSFKEVKFLKGATFHETDFKGNVDFKEAEFHGGEQKGVSFYAIGLDFSKVNFRKKAEFTNSKIIGHVFFNINTCFHGNAEFYGIEVTGSLHLTTVQFNGWVSFRSGKLLNLLYIMRCNFKGEVIFDQIEFAGSAIFSSLKNFNASFHSIQLDPKAIIRFEDLSLAKTQFIGTDLRKVEFRNVSWYPLRRRQTVYDEIKIREVGWEAWDWDVFLKYGWSASYKKMHQLRPRDYSRVEELYRGLKQNYEQVGDYKRVGDFHYGEMEMHRRASPWRRWVSLYSLYWFLSGYGERPLWALGVLLALLFGLSALAWGGGLAFNPNFNPALASPHPVSYCDALVFILEKATLQRPDWLIPQNLVSRVVAGLSVLFIPAQAALFILALRNRLGRRR